MSNGALPQYQFLPWLRQGIANHITGTSIVTAQRASVQISFKVQGKDETIQKQVEFYGPGDVTGFSPRIVVRTDPKPNIGDFEPNYFPLVDFSQPDFPWRYTPLPVVADQERLQPWICLIVLREEASGEENPAEFSIEAQSSERLPSIIVVKNPKNSLPNLSQSWAWAHVQYTPSENDIRPFFEILQDNPEQWISRLLCPRRLDPGILYHAFVVPTFETGRLAGLGGDPSQTEINALAWDTTQETEIKIPYYFDWQFRTGLRGDFEALVRLLEPVELNKNSGVGMRDMSISDPGYNLPAVTRSDRPDDPERESIAGLEGALTTIDAEPDPEPNVKWGDFTNGLISLLNLPTEQLEEEKDKYLVSPPIYGRWHAARDKLPAEKRSWLNELNTDPRNRTVAGFGTLVIQDQQESLMEEAWRQIGPVNEANEAIRRAQLGKAGSEKLYNRHLANLPPADLIWLTSSVHNRVLIPEPDSKDDSKKITISHRLNNYGSPLKPVFRDPALRRIIRKRGPLCRVRQKPDVDPNRPHILDRINEGEVTATDPPPSTLPPKPPWAEGPGWKWLKILHWILIILIIILNLVIAILPRFGIPITPTNPVVLTISAILAILSYIIRRWITPGLVAEAVDAKEIISEYIETFPYRPDFVLENKPGSNFTSGKTGNQDSPAARDFRQFAMAIQGFTNPVDESVVANQPIDLNNLRIVLMGALDPKETIKKRIYGRMKISGSLSRRDEFDIIMAAPEFNQPMYEPLRDRSQELLLPGVGNIRQNTVALLKTNQRFIKSYMVGLNHEMARELLWREYPTDQRGSYFRQFWDVSRFVPPNSMLNKVINSLRQSLEWEKLDTDQKASRIDDSIREKLKDIKPIHTWLNAGLDQHDARGSDVTVKDKVVLLIRGDLLNKYPDTIIYAARAKWNGNSRWPEFNNPDENRRDPIMGGILPPDITFLGFPLTKEEVDGDENLGDNVDNGWFFVIEEPISENRFGMDAPPEDINEHIYETWDDLSWVDVKNNLQSSGYLDITTAPEPTDHDSYTWDSDAATLARITVQKPFRVAIHADDLLPDLPLVDQEPSLDVR